MARKKIREHTSKALLTAHLKRVGGLDLTIKAAQIHANTDFDKLLAENPWLLKEKLVAKPDCLFGQRGKNNLVLLNKEWEETKKFVLERVGTTLEHNGIKGVLTHFIVEPFVPHKEEYYLSIQSLKEGNRISFSSCGGIEIEENWDKVKVLDIGICDEIDKLDVSLFRAEVIPDLRDTCMEFLRAVYKVFVDLDFTFLEMNPFCFDSQLRAVPLDMRGELDSTAQYRNLKKWGDVEFPLPFGQLLSKEEKFVADMDECTGASLKLTLLNPNGRVWAMVAGGGASVIYADTVADLGYNTELGNYGEYSGAPNEEETFKYASTVLDLATRNPDGRNRALLIGGGIANFTDVATTFKGIIRAIRDYQDKIKAAQMKIWVRRGGPNYQAGLKMMKDVGKETGIDISVHGPEILMTKIVPEALSFVEAK